MRCLIFMSRDLIIIPIIRCKPLCYMPGTFDVISSWIFSAPPAQSYLLCVAISFEIAFVICTKVHLTLNFKILSIQTFFFFLISDILSPKKNYMFMHDLRLCLSTTSFRAKYRRACFGKTEDALWLSKEIQWKFYSMMSLFIHVLL